MKSKMPCRPGPVPVADVGHATRDCGGVVAGGPGGGPRPPRAGGGGGAPPPPPRAGGRAAGAPEPPGQPVARVEIGRGGRCVVHAPVLEHDRALQVHTEGSVYHSRMMLSPGSPASALRVSTTRRAVFATAG